MTACIKTADPAPHAVANEVVSPDQATQAEQDLTACSADIVSMIQAIYSQWRDELSTQLRFRELPSIARAFDLRLIYKDLLEDSLKVSNFAVLVPAVRVV